MTSSGGMNQKNQSPPLRMTPVNDIQVPNVCALHGWGEHASENELGRREQSQDAPSELALRTQADANVNEEMFITNILVVDVALGLRRIPAGFYAAVRHSGWEWKTETRPVTVNNDLVEWAGPIPIPSDPLDTIYIAVYASFEFQPVLGDGEQLRRLATTVDQLLERSARGLPFNFFPKDGDAVSPCSSIQFSVTHKKHENGVPLGSAQHDPLRSCTVDPVEEATNHGHGSLSRYRKSGERCDLERSTIHFDRALGICSLDHPCRPAAQSNLATARFIYSRIVEANPSFDISITLYRNALDARPPGHPDRPSTLLQLAMVHCVRFEKRRNELDATKAGELLHEVMKISPPNSHEKREATFLLQLQAKRESARAQRGARLGVGPSFSSELTGEDLWNTSVQLGERFERYGDVADLAQAISLMEEGVRSTSLWDAQHFMWLTNLGAALTQRFERLGELEDLERAISCHRQAASLIPDGHPNKPPCLSHLGGTLCLRSTHLGELRDLDEGILTLRSAVFLSMNDPVSLHHLGASLLARFQRLGELDNLQEAISRLKDSVDLVDDHHALKPISLSNLGNALSARFQRLGDLTDLDGAIINQSIAMDLTLDDHPRKSGHLNNLACLLQARFERLGEPSDLAQAIFKHSDAVNLTPDGHPQKAGRLNNLGVAYFTRFKHFEELSDLQQAIFSFSDSLDLVPDGHPNKHGPLHNLGIAFQYRFQRLGRVSDLEEAISRLRDSVYLTPDGHPEKPGTLNDLGESLRLLFVHSGEPDVIQESISRLMDTIDLTPNGHPDRAIYLNNLGNSFLARFRALRQPSDLEQMISRYMDSVRLIPDGHSQNPCFVNNLASALLYRFEHTGEPSDAEQAMLLYSRAASISVGPIAARFEASEGWISSARTLRHSSLLDAYSLAVTLLPQLAWVGLPLHERYIQLGKGVDVVREAAAAALDAGLPETAVEWLEQGRSIVWGELFHLRSSYEELTSAYPDHAHKLRELSVALERAGTTRENRLSSLSDETDFSQRPATLPLEHEANTHHALAILRDKLLKEIRNLPGFERFLLHKEFSRLRALAHSGPVVILNAAKTRCDALCVLAEVDHVFHVPLPSFTLNKVKLLQSMLKSLLGPTRDSDVPDDDRVARRITRGSISWELVLSTLWNGVVKPVLDALNFSIHDGAPSRIFWCPTGPFAFLPIHAAGLYGPRSQPGQKLSDFVISSYVPTLSILAPQPEQKAVSGENICLLAIRQPPSDGQSLLPGVDTELRCIRSAVQSSASTQVTLMETAFGTVEEVLLLMKDADWVHFACHGVQDPMNPIDSGLCLADRRRLKLSDVISVSRPRGGLAFLSACQTATGDKSLSDEAIHVAAGMLFAGYGGVIGTMWSISDRVAPLVAKHVYEQLFRAGTRPDYRDAARALHGAMERLRNSNASFMEWLPFIHVGL